MKFANITTEDLFGKGVTGLPDTPGLSTQEMQAKFDELVKDVMVPKFNALVEELKKIAVIESVSQTVEDSETSIPTGKAVKAVTDSLEQKTETLAKKPVYKSKKSFPEVGNADSIYIDDTVSPRLLYTWDAEEGYVLTGGSGSGNCIFVEISKEDYKKLPEEEKESDQIAYFVYNMNVGGNDNPDTPSEPSEPSVPTEPIELSHIGMVIHTTTLDTMEKVIEFYGGTTWTKIEGVFLLGQSAKYAINSTGGEYTHTLTIEEMPGHNHTFTGETRAITDVGELGGFGCPITTLESNEYRSQPNDMMNTGGSKPHNNMPPYKTVYIWERTA